MSTGPVEVPLPNVFCWLLGKCQFYHSSVRGDRETIVKINGEVKTLTFEELFNMFSERAIRIGGSEVIPVSNLDVYALTPKAVLRNPEYYMTEKELKCFNAYKMGGLPKLVMARQLNVFRETINSALRKASSDLFTVVGGWGKVKYIIRHKVSKRMFRVATKYGETVVTEDHSLLALKDGRLVEVKPEQCKTLPPARIHLLEVGDPTETVDLWKHLKGEKAFKIRCRRCGYEWVSSIETKCRRCCRCRSRRLEVVGETEYSDGFYLDGNVIKHVKSAFSVPRYLEGDPLKSFLRLIAAYVTEGSLVDPRRCVRGRVEISNGDVEWLKQLADAARNLNLSTYIRFCKDFRDERFSIYRLVILSTPFMKLIEKLCGRHAQNKRLPDFVLMLDKDYINVLLNDMIKGDGYRERREKYSEEYREKHFRYATTSRRLVAQLSFILTRLGIKYSVWYNIKEGFKPIYTISACTKYWRDSNQKVVVEDVTEGEEYVYDLEVEGSHAFVDGVGLLTLHNTAFYIIPPGLDVTILWYPEEEDKVQLIFALSFGRPRNYLTGEVVISDEVGFWHRGSGMKLHWDPLTESIFQIVYPHITPATKENPFEVRFVNRTNTIVIMDVSIWIFEYHKKDYEEFLEFTRGFVNFFRLFGRAKTVEEAEAILKKLVGG